MPLFVENGRMMWRDDKPSKGKSSTRTLVQCAIPGCGSEPMSEGEFEVHLLFHEEATEEEMATLEATADDEGIYSVTSIGEESDGGDGF